MTRRTTAAEIDTATRFFEESCSALITLEYLLDGASATVLGELPAGITDRFWVFPTYRRRRGSRHQLGEPILTLGL